MECLFANKIDIIFKTEIDILWKFIVLNKYYACIYKYAMSSIIYATSYKNIKKPLRLCIFLYS